MTDKQIDFKILFHLLSLTNFEYAFWEGGKLTNYSIENISKIIDYWESAIGRNKFLVELNDEKLRKLEKAFIKLNFELKIKIINNNLMFGAFLQDNEVFPFINNPLSSNWKFFALTFKNNISEFDFRKVEIKGSIHQIGRFLLFNKRIKDRINRIKEIINDWDIYFQIADKNYLSICQIDKLFKEVKDYKYKLFEWIKKKSEFKPINYYQALKFQEIIGKSKLCKKNKRKFFELSEKWKKESLKHSINRENKFVFNNEVEITLNKIKSNLLKHKAKFPWDYVGILEEKRAKIPQVFEVILKRPIFFKHVSKIPKKYIYSFSMVLFYLLVHYKEFMKQNLTKYSKEIREKNNSLQKIDCDFYYFLERKMFFEAGFIAIGFFFRTIEKLFPWKIKLFQDRRRSFWNVCEEIKKYMSKSYQYSIELTFCSAWPKNYGYLDARNKLMHFEENFGELDAFAIYTLAVENQRIINAKIPIEYYKDEDFVNNKKSSRKIVEERN